MKTNVFSRLYYKIVEYLTFVPDGYRFILGSLVACILLFFISALLSTYALLALLYFAKVFHLPTRVDKGFKNSVISPADGKIVSITQAKLPSLLAEFSPDSSDDKEFLLISIEIGFFNLKMNTIPITGFIDRQAYRTNDNSWLRAKNSQGQVESNIICIKEDRKSKNSVVVEQRAGYFKHSVVSFMFENDLVQSGEVFGALRFGKHVNLYLPINTSLYVTEGQTVIAGETLIGFLPKSTSKGRIKRLQQMPSAQTTS